LRDVVVASLGRLQYELRGEIPSVRDVWDLKEKRGKNNPVVWEPHDENDFSDFVARHLRRDLRECGIVSLREVEIRRGNGQPGERTDIYVVATVEGAKPDTRRAIRVILEVKGCWHAELKTAMKTQLRDRYLADNECEHGIYVVGWFICDAWNDKDYRKSATPKWSYAEAISHFDRQATNLSTANARLYACVLNTSLK